MGPPDRDWAATVRRWSVWELPGWVLVFVLVVIVADIGAITTTTLFTAVRGHDAEIFAVLLACDLAMVELTRRSDEPSGHIRGAHAIWELPLALLLPPLYGLIAPAIRIAFTQWRGHRALAYRRIYTAAVLGLTYAASSVVFHMIRPDPAGSLLHPPPRAAGWALAFILCGLLRAALSVFLMMTAIRGADPSVSIRAEVLSRESLFTEAAELSVGALIAYAVTGSPLLALLALPPATMLQRSERHSQLSSDSRVDARTGLLKAAPWRREAAAELRRTAHGGVPQFLALVSLDNLASAVESAGPAAGGQLLGRVAVVLRNLLPGQLIGGFRDDQFAILLTCAETAAARRICERVHSEIASSAIEVETGGQSTLVFRLTVSIGVAGPADSGRLPDLVGAATAALTEARHSGWNKVTVYADLEGGAAEAWPTRSA